METQRGPPSNIPRPSRLPVRATTVQKPAQVPSDQPFTTTTEVQSINVSRLRPRVDFPKPDGRAVLPASRPAKPPQNETTARKDPPTSTIYGADGASKKQSALAGSQDTRNASVKPGSRRPRPSLSDRAIESLSQIPPSPSPRRRQSGFFLADSPAVRPPSSLGRSRPITSTGFYPPLPTPRPTSPLKRPATIRANQPNVSTQSKASSSTSVMGRPTRPAFRNLEGTPSRNPRSPIKDSEAEANRLKSFASREVKGAQKPKRLQSVEPLTSAADSKASPKSSAALRETIANARAARRAAPKYETDELVKPVNQSFNPSGVDDEDGMHINILRKQMNSARSDGKLNISRLGLEKFPEEIFKMYEPDAITDGPTWYESVDLTRLDASNNEIQDLGWDDLDSQTENEEDQSGVTIFSSLQTLDLHDNRLHTVPSILRTFKHLTVLNLSRNRLKGLNELGRIVSSIKSLRELYLAENGYSGSFPPFNQCLNLEILDLHANNITSLPEDLSNCTRLRRLDVSKNKVTEFPVLNLPSLTILNVSANQIDLDSLTANLKMPQLVDLDVSMCRVDNLPALRLAYPNLTLVIAFDNYISAIDVESVRGLEILDLRRNDIRVLPPELSLLGFKKLLVGGNPMRAPRREILEGTTERLTEWLKGRLPANVLDEETF